MIGRMSYSNQMLLRNLILLSIKNSFHNLFLINFSNREIETFVFIVLKMIV